MHSNAEAVAGEAVSESRHTCFKFASEQEVEATDAGRSEAAGKNRRYRGQMRQLAQERCRALLPAKVVASGYSPSLSTS